MVTSLKPKSKKLREDGKVILHVFVDPPVRQGLHLLAMMQEVDANDVLKVLVRGELKRKQLPVPKGLLESAAS